jgi:D-alanine-D-alanine ligase
VKKSVIVLYGGISTEHEISCRSAKFIIDHLDSAKFNVIPVAVTKKGEWFAQDLGTLKNAKAALPIKVGTATQASVVGHFDLLKSWLGIRPETEAQDVVMFPMIHGTGGEDGSLQGWLEWCGVPYVGCGVLGSAVAMNKPMAKKLVKGLGIPIAAFHSFKDDGNWRHRAANDSKHLGLPLFVKPANLGSAVGVSKVTKLEELIAAIEEVFCYDNEVLIEQEIRGREIEFAGIGEYEPKISAPGEIVTASQTFYTYDEKYSSSSRAEVKVPADIPAGLLEQGRQFASQIWRELDLFGMSRIDFFLTQEGKFVFNEVNTIPGFTDISQYPRLLMHEGYSSQGLVEELIRLAVSRFERKNKLKRSIG